MRPFFMRKMFGPAPIPKKFDGFPKEMALRPSQIRASALESALMIPDAFSMQKDYGDMKMPVVIIAGEEDQGDRHRQTVSTPSPGCHSEYAASYPRSWPHGASKRHGRPNGGHRRSRGLSNESETPARERRRRLEALPRPHRPSALNPRQQLGETGETMPEI